MDKHVLSDDTLARLARLVEQGAFRSMDEAVRAGLDLYDQTTRQETIQRLRAQIRTGLESGPSEPFDVEEFLSELEGASAA